MSPHVETEPRLVEDKPQFKRLDTFTADAWKFKLHPIESPVMMIYGLGGFYGGYVCLTCAKLPTIIFTFSLVYPCMLALTAGVHRLWSHRAYKARAPLQLLLTFLYILTNQRSIITWVRRHRLHHLCSDTDADPHNATRGFFFSQFGWMLVEPHPEVAKREKHIDVSDLMNNPIVKFQHEYFAYLVTIIAYVIPTYIPIALFGESLYAAYWSNIFRMNMVMHLVNTINSIAHLVGYRPIDKMIPGTQYPFIGLVTLGEGFHNYHHSFPYDYRASEIGDYRLNLTAPFIDFMAKIGQAYDLKTVSEDIVRGRVLKNGDGTDLYYIPNNEVKQDFFCTKYYNRMGKCNQ
ncbi:acyl-CoA Delta(11) desaturase-like [Plodia interpunctella]|uniref:acyl-CoA Delta(11) desaturase-like n=1 Tax=Plodia interpunctella TaxID=58824 RepID=UPI002367CEC9|nr:acyl-CoA Delta(11) desaturase-like [Plodia interpunctella]